MFYPEAISAIDEKGVILFKNGRVGQMYEFSGTCPLAISDEDGKYRGFITSLALEACPNLIVYTYLVRRPYEAQTAIDADTIESRRNTVLRRQFAGQWTSYLLFMTKGSTNLNLTGLSDFLGALLGKPVTTASALESDYKELVNDTLTPEVSAFLSQAGSLINTHAMQRQAVMSFFKVIANGNQALFDEPANHSEPARSMLVSEVTANFKKGYVNFISDGDHKTGIVSTARSIKTEYLPNALAGVFEAPESELVVLCYVWQTFTDHERTIFFRNEHVKTSDMDMSIRKFRNAPKSADKADNFSSYLRKEVKELQDSERKADAWGRATIQVLVVDSNARTANACSGVICSTLRKKYVMMKTETRGVLASLNGFHPGCYKSLVRRIHMQSAAGGLLMPLYTDDQGDETGTISLRTRHASPYKYARIQRDLGGMVCVGVVGSGKSVLMNTITGYNCEDGRSVVLSYDVGNRGLLDKFEGDSYSFPADPLNVFGSGNQAHILDLILSISQPAKGSDDEREIITAVKDTFAAPATPSFPVFLEHLRSPIVEKYLSKWLEGGANEGAINGVHQSDGLGFSKPLTFFDIKQLEDSEEVREVFLRELCFRVSQFFTSPDATQIPKMLSVDEAHVALKIPYLSNLLESIARTGRKYNSCVAAFTQKVDELIGFDGWVPFRDSCGTWVFGADPDAGDKYIEAFPKLTEHHLSLIRTLTPRREYLFVQPYRQSFQVVRLDLDIHTLAWASTNPADRNRCRDLVAQKGREFGVTSFAVELKERLYA